MSAVPFHRTSSYVKNSGPETWRTHGIYEPWEQVEGSRLTVNYPSTFWILQINNEETQTFLDRMFPRGVISYWLFQKISRTVSKDVGGSGGHVCKSEETVLMYWDPPKMTVQSLPETIKDRSTNTRSDSCPPKFRDWVPRTRQQEHSQICVNRLRCGRHVDWLSPTVYVNSKVRMDRSPGSISLSRTPDHLPWHYHVAEKDHTVTQKLQDVHVPQDCTSSTS